MLPRSLQRLALCMMVVAVLGGYVQKCYGIGKVVAFVPEGGEWSDVGWVMRSAYMTAMRLNGANQVFELIIEDCSDQGKLSVLLTRYENDNEVMAFIGGMPSSRTSQIACSAEKTGIPYIIDCNTADSLTWTNRRFVFRLSPPASDFNDGLISWSATVAGIGRTAAVVCDTSRYYSSILSDLEQDLANHWEGNKIWLPIQRNANKFDYQIDLLADATPALVFLIGETSDIARFLKQCKQFDYMPYAFVLAGSNLVNSRLISASEGAANFTVAPLIWNPNLTLPETKKFVDSYEKVSSEHVDFRAASCASGIQILTRLFRNRSLTGREQLRLELAEQRFNTVFGEVQFDNYGRYTNQNRTATLAIQRLGDSWQVIWPVENSHADDVYPVPDWRERNRKSFERKSTMELWILSGLTIMMFIGYLRYRLIKPKTDDE